MTTVVPDGEYEIHLPESLLSQWRSQSTEDDHNKELFTLGFMERPEDDTQTYELTRTGDEFLLKMKNSERDEVTYGGSITHHKGTECMLVYSEKKKSFDLRNVSVQLNASDDIKVKPKRMDKQQPKRRKHEPSIFAPKTRPLSPLALSGGHKRSGSIPPANLLSDDEIPLAKTSPMKITSSSRPSAPSPLAISMSPVQAVSSASKSTLLSRATTPRVSESTPPPSVSTIQTPIAKQFITTGQVASKKPPSSSTIMTPALPETDGVSDEEDFGALVDELEEELLSDDNGFNIIEDDRDTKNTTMTPSLGSNFDFDYNGKAPMSFRDLAGMGDDEDDITSSSEEE